LQSIVELLIIKQKEITKTMADSAFKSQVHKCV